MPSVLPGRGSLWVGGADRQVAHSERREEQESIEVHANASTALIKRGASRPLSDGLTDAGHP